MENDEFILPGETNNEVGLAALKTIESLKGVSNALDCRRMEIGCADRRKASSKPWISGVRKN